MVKCVLFEVRTEFLNIIWTRVGFEGMKQDHASIHPNNYIALIRIKWCNDGYLWTLLTFTTEAAPLNNLHTRTIRMASTPTVESDDVNTIWPLLPPRAKDVDYFEYHIRYHVM
jgi:hypothetical protein